MDTLQGFSGYLGKRKRYFYFFCISVVLFMFGMFGLFFIGSAVIVTSLALLMFSTFFVSAFKCYRVSAFSDSMSGKILFTGKKRNDLLEVVDLKLQENDVIQSELVELMVKLTKKEYDSNVSAVFKASKFYLPYKSLSEELEQSKRILETQRWASEGENKLTRILQQNLNGEIEESASKFLSGLINYVGACQGLIYLVEQNDRKENYLRRIASYADETTSLEIVDWGAGLLGNSIAKNEVQVYDNIPDDFVTISSGLGAGKAKVLVIVPIYHNSKPLAIFELVMFKKLSAEEIHFLEKVGDILGGVFESMRAGKRTKHLLELSESTRRELMESEVSLMQHQEELNTAQEQLNMKLHELQVESNLTACIVSAINKTNASVEFDMDGKILNANNMFLAVMGYKLGDLIGKPESFILTDQETGLEKSEMIWCSLREGNFITGEFILKSSFGRDVWMEASYNPIVDLDGKPYKVIMFASFTTELKEKENEYRNKLSIINEHCVFLDINLDGVIRNANQKFLDIMNIKRKDMRGLSFKELTNVKQNYVNGSAVFTGQYPTDSSIEGHLFMKDLSGKMHEFDATIMPNKSMDGTVQGYMVLLSHHVHN